MITEVERNGCLAGDSAPCPGVILDAVRPERWMIVSDRPVRTLSGGHDCARRTGAVETAGRPPGAHRMYCHAYYG